MSLHIHVFIKLKIGKMLLMVVLVRTVYILKVLIINKIYQLFMTINTIFYTSLTNYTVERINTSQYNQDLIYIK